jgi:flagellar hook-associated protein 1
VAQREATSGVSLDEEAINLTKYERSFQGASRFLSVLDTLSLDILNLVSTA